MDAIRTMVDNEVGSLVVQDGSERVVGFLTGRDMLRTVVTKGKLSEYGTEPEGWNVPVSSVMTPVSWSSCTPALMPNPRPRPSPDPSPSPNPQA